MRPSKPADTWSGDSVELVKAVMSGETDERVREGAVLTETGVRITRRRGEVTTSVDEAAMLP